MNAPTEHISRRTVLAAGLAGAGFSALGAAPADAAPITAQQIVEAKQRLTDQGFYCGPVTGTINDATTCAVLAFQKSTGMQPDGLLDYSVMVALKASRTLPRFTSKGSVVEVDLERQLVRLVSDGSVLATLHASTGDGRVSVLGTRNILNRTPHGKFRLRTVIPDGALNTSLGTLFRPHPFWDDYAVYGRSDLASLRAPATLGGVAVYSPALTWWESSGYLPAGRAVVIA